MKNLKGSYVFGHIKGFTLIELLVVVAIIGILASVVLASLNSARTKGGDAAVKSNLNTTKGAAELFYVNNNFSFLPSSGSTFALATCPVYSATGTNMLSKDKTIAGAIAEAVKRGGGGSACYNSNSAWAIAVRLRTGGTVADAIPDSWCVDSGGKSKSYTWTTGQTIVNSINGTACR